MSEARKSAAMYLVTVGLCLAGVTGALKLWKADPSVPLIYGGDALITQFWAKSVVENGWYLTNESVGVPFGLEMHDFPLSDGLFFVMLRALSWVTKDYVRVLNVYYILTFPLCALTSAFVLRRFGVSRVPAVVASVLFALAPYHFFRGQEHLFLASYLLVPLAVMTVLRVYLDDRLEPSRAGDPGTWSGLGLCVLIGSGGVYYAFFTCYLLVFSGMSAALRRGKAYPLKTAGIAIAVIAASVLVNISPKFVFAIRHGPNPEAVVRDPSHSEIFGLKVLQMLLPVSGHRVPPLARLKARYDVALAPLVNENTSSALGAVAALGFLSLSAGLLWRLSRGAESPRAWAGLVDLNLAALLLATFGGFGTLFGYLISSWVRGYCRMSIFIAFFSLFAVALALAWLDRLVRARGPRWFFHAGLGALLIAGALDQTTPSFVPKYDQIKQKFQDDASFIGRVEASLPRRSLVFQLPYTHYPEPTTVHRMHWYEHLRGYLHSQDLRWSYGAMRGRYGDVWQSSVASEPPAGMARRLALAGFGGIYLDRAGYVDSGADLECALTRLLGERPLISRGGRFSFFPLERHAESLVQGLSASERAALREESLHPVLERWGEGFYGREEGPNGPFRWSYGSGEIALMNPSPHPRRVGLSMILSTVASGPSWVRMTGPGGRTALRVDSTGRPFHRSMILPPGTTRLSLAGTGPKVTPAGDSRALMFRVEGFTISEPGVVVERSKAGEVRR